jgi:hypothetical protein
MFFSKENSIIGFGKENPTLSFSKENLKKRFW